ncbi:methyl-accepting chemotaxis protein [Mangrovicoccus algicola]|uniref:Cache domain-containing protein n=1 Tax=Mangrovicoccus algicola TaxID=2771008 RepID=A0A8J6Z564_9RHOB|nr:methyl-accepting chemotaxis protein [Mangrovicoccus algicola]MBE3637884.1 cache domain-containing protein [Mangrovicoccus algicola]
MKTAFGLRIGGRIYAIVLVVLLAVGALAATMYTLAERNTLRMREAHLRDVVDAAIFSLEAVQYRVEAGEISPEAALVEGERVLNAMRYDGDGYFFALDHDAVVTAHGSNPALVGTDQSGFEDPEGIKVFLEFIDLAAQGGGTLDYSFARFGDDGSAEMVPKLGFVRPFEPWGWIVGTGTYLEDLHAQMAVLRNIGMAVGLAGMVILGVVIVAIARSVTRPLASLNARMATLSAGDLEADIPCLSSRDEFGEMARAVQGFRDGLRENARLSAEVEARHKAEVAAEAQRLEAEQEKKRAEQEREREAEQARRDAQAREEALRAESVEKADRERRETLARQEQVVSILADALRTLAAGDLGARIDQEFDGAYEELRNDFNSTVDTLEEVIAGISESSGHIVEKGEAITSSAEDVAKRTEQAAATLEETAAALEQLTSSVALAAKGAKDADRIVVDARGTAEQSGEVVRQAVEAMGAIEQSSDKISKIIHVIDDIAFQTNLLALNAGVEAARAGEAGRGFAVVASEVRALAQRSSDAAREINALISESGEQVNRGVSLVGEAGETLRRIAASVSEISSHVSDIARSAGEQSVGLGEINTSVSHLDNTTQANTALFQDTLSASQSLTREAVNLGNAVAQFRLSPGRAAALARLAPAGPSEEMAASPGSSPVPAERPARRASAGGGPAAAAAPPAASPVDDGGWEDF